MGIGGGRDIFYDRIADAVDRGREARDGRLGSKPPPIVYRRPFLINAFHSVIPTDWNKKLIEEGTHPDGELKEHERKLAGDAAGVKGVFFGIAGFKSLDMLSLIGSEVSSEDGRKPRTRKYTRAILCDINTRQVEAMRKALAAISEYENPDDFILHFSTHYPELMKQPTQDVPRGKQYQTRLSEDEKSQYYNAYGNSYTPPPNPDSLRQWCAKEQQENPYSWLKEKNYKHIRDLVKSGRIAVLTADLRDKDVMGAIRQELDKNEWHVGHCYVSSVMDFMDPYVKTGYYSGEQSLDGIRRFYENLLHLTVADTKFIASASSPAEKSPILHNYELERLSRGDIEARRRALPDKEPGNSEKTCSILFNTGDQVWRLAEFEMPVGEGHYFRIFSETKPHDMVKLAGQIETINSIEESLVRMKSSREMASGRWVQDFAIADTPEAKFFAQQENLPPEQRRMFSCKPFTLKASRGQDVHKTIEELVKSIKGALQPRGQKNASVPGAESQETTSWNPKVVVKKVGLGSVAPVSQSPVVPPPSKKPEGPGLFG